MTSTIDAGGGFSYLAREVGLDLGVTLVLAAHRADVANR